MAFILQLPQSPCAFTKIDKKVNAALTRQVTTLHSKGYCSDFLIDDDGHFFCVQDNREYVREQLTVELVDQGYDQFSRSYQYIHTVETESGEKGILMLKRIFFNPLASMLMSDREPG